MFPRAGIPWGQIKDLAPNLKKSALFPKCFALMLWPTAWKVDNVPRPKPKPKGDHHLMLLSIGVTVIAAVMLGGIICLIPVLLQIRRTAHQAEKLLESVRMQVPALGQNVILISNEVSSILRSAHREFERLKELDARFFELVALSRGAQQRSTDLFPHPSPLLNWGAAVWGAEGPGTFDGSFTILSLKENDHA